MSFEYEYPSKMKQNTKHFFFSTRVIDRSHGKEVEYHIISLA